MKTPTPEEIRAIREGLGLTQKQFAHAMNVSRTATVAEWESGAYKPSGPAVKLMYLLERFHA